MSRNAVKDHLDRLADEGRTVTFWLRDDDAVTPTPALDRLLMLTSAHEVPLTLAVIPEETGEALARRLASVPLARVAVHGWSHRSYAVPPAKKQELGLDRPLESVTDELQAGFEKLRELYPAQFLPMLVPPWNRIAPAIVDRLPAIGFTSLSVFGREKSAPLALLNTHVDIMDWHGSHGGKPAEALFAELLSYLAGEEPMRPIGILTHHLVHDAAAWDFLEQLFALTASHPACRWRHSAEILSA
ncbi:peptidoglycan/xylan/chitin deacetylase (PgdA/CDA1 family) [Neorhizobium galegae]|uniref:polysaccharide deacetylase family protein n=1 Tax=Neorhizobium galegae TaxID=399 RepID=UPI001AEB59B0|nr:polysaccharide deacetylase family protein [Neorhizobium galegae]MBP2551531.1 peptidoglycan/xylan/chitin deacetylase (PgdA/CDA1 family) [Neorhizobium galegae]